MTRVDVVDFDEDDDPLSIDDCPEVPGIPVVLYLPAPRWITPTEIDRRANLLDETWRFASLVVCRVHPAQAEEFTAAAAIREDLTARFPGVPVVLLSFTDKFIWEFLSGDLDSGVEEPLRSALAHAELRAVLDRAGVLLPATEGFHYEGPSGEHYESFVRVGTALSQVDALDSAAFWLLPHLVRSPVIVLDSWTIISLGLSAAQYLRDNRILGPDGEPARVVAVETRRSYSEPGQRLLQHLTALRKRDSDRAASPVLALTSVSSTGGTALRLTQTCQQAGFGDVTSLALYRSSDAREPRALCVLDEVSRHWPSSAECPHCAQRSQLVRVMPDTFLLDLAATVVDDVAITLYDADLVRRFLERFAGCGALSVHRDQHDGQRHHMIYVDVLPLLEHEQYRRRLDDEIADIERIDLVLTPEHEAARALGAAAAERIGSPLLHADPQRLLDLNEAEVTLLNAARRILVIDDVVITGTRLRHYRNMLHRQGIALKQDFELHVLAGVARPSSLERLKGVMDFTHDQDRFHFVELLPLPNWGARECPWCQELELLRDFGAEAAESRILEQRFKALQDTASGLTQELFLPWLADRGEMSDPMLLGPHSIFMAETEPELFGAVASSLQALRNARKLNERFTLPVAKVLSRDFAFEGRFYDTAITACLLRAARRHDLRASLVDPELEQMAIQRLSEPPPFGLHGELLLALFRGQLPGGAIAARESAVWAQQGVEVGVRDVLRVALES